MKSHRRLAFLILLSMQCAYLESTSAFVDVYYARSMSAGILNVHHNHSIDLSSIVLQFFISKRDNKCFSSRWSKFIHCGQGKHNSRLSGLFFLFNFSSPPDRKYPLA